MHIKSHLNFPQHETSLPKCRPVATVRPFPATKKGEQQGQESDSEFLESLGKQLTFHEDFEESDENTKNCGSCNSGEKSDNCSTARFDQSCESREEEQVFPSPSHPIEAPSPPSPQPPPPPTQSTPSETKLTSRETDTRQETRHPCRHRDKLRAVFGNRDTLLTSSTTIMEVYQNGGECHNGQGCAGDIGESLKESRYKETCLTECLDGEFFTTTPPHPWTHGLNSRPIHPCPSTLVFSSAHTHTHTLFTSSNVITTLALSVIFVMLLNIFILF